MYNVYFIKSTEASLVVNICIPANSDGLKKVTSTTVLLPHPQITQLTYPNFI